MNNKAIQSAVEHITNARTWLDATMYSSPQEVSNTQYDRLRKAYNLLCEATDILHNIPL